MTWSRERVTERGREYVDHVRGPHRVAEGYDEPARREGRPWTLLERGRHVHTFATLREAQRAAGGAE